MNKEEYLRDQMRQEDMVKSIVRGYEVQEKEKTLGKLNEALSSLDKIVQDLMKIIKELKENRINPTS